jgi:uncharacterized protein (TIRG00374 family)
MTLPISQQFIRCSDHKHTGDMESGYRVQEYATLSHVALFDTKKISRGKLMIGGLVFVTLTALIFWYQFYQIQPDAEPLKWNRLRLEYLLLIFLCLPLDTLACGLRISLVCRVLHPGVGFWTCLKAEWANLGIAMLTPAQTGGGFGQIYMLNRGGLRIASALTVSLITFLGTMVGLVSIGLYSLLVLGVGQIGSFIYGAIWIFTSIFGLMAIALVSPGLFCAMVSFILKTIRQISGKNSELEDYGIHKTDCTSFPKDRIGFLAAKLIDLVNTYHNDVWKFIRIGKSSFVWVCLLSFAFIFSRCLMAFLCLRFLGVSASDLGHVLEIQLALIFLVYFAPTPGSSGLAEGASFSMMADIVPLGFAPYYNLLWRSLTLYLPSIVGLVCLLMAVVKDAGRQSK